MTLAILALCTVAGLTIYRAIRPALVSLFA
jgi:hypothetical protein